MKASLGAFWCHRGLFLGNSLGQIHSPLAQYSSFDPAQFMDHSMPEFSRLNFTKGVCTKTWISGKKRLSVQGWCQNHLAGTFELRNLNCGQHSTDQLARYHNQQSYYIEVSRKGLLPENLENTNAESVGKQCTTPHPYENVASGNY